MAQAEIEALRAVYEAVSRGDWDAAFHDARPDFELQTPDQNPIAGTYRGREAIRGFFAEIWAAFEEVTVQPEHFLELDDRILVSLHMQLRPSGSGATVDMRLTHLWTMRDGKPARCDVFLRREQALEAVGLSEQDPRAQLGYGRATDSPPLPPQEVFLGRVDQDRAGVSVQHGSSRTLVIAFGGLWGGLGPVPVFEFQRTLAASGLQSVFLRDHYRAWYHRGVADVGDDVDSVASFLQPMTRTADRIVMIGNSAGGYAALLFGALLGCEAHAFSPQTFIDPALRRQHRDARWAEDLSALLETGRFDARYGDLAPLLASRPGNFHIHYGTAAALDVLHAERMRDLAHLHAISGGHHGAVQTLRDSGWLESFFGDL